MKAYLPVAAILLLYGVNLGALEFRSKDEARSGVIVRDVTEGGRWMLPRTPDGFFCEKPPVYYWLCAGLSCLFGVSEWTLRLVSAAAAAGTLALVWMLTGLYGSRRASLIAAVALGSNFIFMTWVRRAMVDMTFTFFVAAGLTSWLAWRRGRLRPRAAAVLGGVSFGLAALTKGPLGLVLPGAVIAADMLVETRGRFWRAGAAWALAAAAFGTAAAIILAWYVPAAVWGGREFVETAVLSENVYMPLGQARGLGVSHLKPLYFYPLLQVGLILVAGPFVPHVLRWCFRRRGDPARVPLAVWLLVGLAIFTAAANKRTHYLLPLQPAVAAMIGLAVAEALERPSDRLLRWGARVAGALALLAGAAGLALALRPSLAPRLSLESVRPGLAVLSLLAAGAGAAMFVPAWTWRAALALALLAPAVQPLVVDGVVDSRQGPRARDVVRAMLERMPPGAAPVVRPPLYGYTMDFYWPGRLERDERVAERAGWFFVRKDLLPELRVEVEVVGELADRREDRSVVLVRRR